MNYLTEIKLFYDWLETHSLTPASIALWHGLMYIANRAGWPMRLCIPMTMLEARTHIPRPTLYRERKRLQQAGLIDFSAQGSRLSSIYVLRSLEERFVFHGETQKHVSASFVSHTDTQNEKREAPDSQFVSHGDTQTATIYRLHCTSGKDEEKYGAGMPAPELTNSPPKKEKNCGKKERKSAPLFEAEQWLEHIELPWRELMSSWLEYKRTRRERYKSELSASKCLSQLRRLACNDPQAARQIVDQSIACNWAGLFPLRGGLHPGQILQNTDEEHRRRLLEKFGSRDKV